MLHYPAASLSTSYGYSYTSYPSYSSSLLLLSRYSNARYARVDVPDWDFRPRPGQNRLDPSGTISRGRSVVRIRTMRAGKRRGKTPGARLVEKFIIRGPTGSAASEAGGRFAKNPGPVSGKDDRGGEGPAIRVPENCAHLCAKVPEIVGNPPSSAQKPARNSTKFKFSRNSPKNSPQKTPRHSPENPPKSDSTPKNSPTPDLCKIPSSPENCEDLCEGIPEIVGNPPFSAQNPPEPARDFSRKSPQNLSPENLAKKHELSPKTKKKLKPYDKSKKTDLLKKEPDKFTSDSNNCENPSEIKQVSKSQSLKEKSVDFDPENAPKLLNFTAKAPPGVQKVQPLKPLPDNSQIRSEVPSNCVSETKVKVPTNAKCAEAKTENKFSVPISPNQITGERNPENSVDFDLGESITTGKFSDAAPELKVQPTSQQNSEFPEKLCNFSKRKTAEPTKPAKVDKTQQRATTTGQPQETPSESLNLSQNENSVSNLKRAKNLTQLNKINDENVVSDGNGKNNEKSGFVEKVQSELKILKPKAEPKILKDNQPSSEGGKKGEPKNIVKTVQKDQLKPVKTTQRDTVKAAKVENKGKNLPGQVEQILTVQRGAENGENVVENGENGVKNRKFDDNNNQVLCLRDLSELGSLYEEFRVVGDSQIEDLGEDWEILEVIVDMEGTKKKKKVIVKKKGSKVKVTPIEAKPPVKGSGAVTASPGDITRQLSKKRVSLADDELNLVGFSVDRKTSITDDVLVEEAALFDKMIKKELKDARKSSLAFPPIAEDKEVADALAALAAKAARTPSPKRWVPSPQERREMWKKNALRQSKKGLGGFFKPQASSPATSSESECDVNCHQKCQELMPNLCGVNQKLMAEALLCLKRDRRSASGSHTRTSLFKLDSESEDSQCDGRVTPPAPPAKTLPRFRTYNINDFQFLKVLGKGSFGKVLLAELKGSQCYYAVKCLKKDVVLEDDDVECTMIERKVLALGTGHPYFCHLFCTFQTESHLFFVMEYLNGGDLMFHIQQSGRFDEGRARFYAAEIVSALAFLHKLGIVYRDLKLDNVLLDFDGHVRIADFGMCKLQIYLDKTTDTFCGTPDYMAPEIIKGLNYNHCVDWWSFGILLYEMLVGQSPFSGCDEDHLFWSICNERPHMPRHLSQPAVAILREFLEKDWTKRLGSSEFGSQDVMNHRFFDGMRWHLLERRQVDPPYKPTTKHPLDTKYFDRAFTSEKPVLTPVDKAILESMDQSQFEGFSYTNPNATE